MKVNDAIVYVDRYGDAHTAVAEAVVGSGPSGFKTLDVALTDGRRYAGVPHERDQDAAGYWRQVDEPGPEPKRRGRPKK